MAVSELIRATLRERHISLQDLAAKLGWSAQNLSNKMSRANFTESDFRAIAEAMGAEAEISFRFPDDDNNAIDTMSPFVMTSDRRHLIIPGMSAENELYILRWSYDGDYIADRDAGNLHLNGLIVNLRGKTPHLYPVLYIPGTGDPTIGAIVNSLQLSDAAEHIRLVQIAQRAAELAVEFMEPYIR